MKTPDDMDPQARSHISHPDMSAWPPNGRARSRIALSILFASFGTSSSTGAVQLPAIQQATGASKSMLGGYLLVLGIGALIGRQVSPRLIERSDSHRIAVTEDCSPTVGSSSLR